MGMRTNSAVSLTDKSVLKPLLLGAIFEWAVDDSRIDRAADERGKARIGAAGDRLQGDVFVRIEAIAAEQLIDRRNRPSCRKC